MAGAACKLLLCGHRFSAEISSADTMAQLQGMSTSSLEALMMEKLGGQSAYDALVSALNNGVEAMTKVNAVLMP